MFKQLNRNTEVTSIDVIATGIGILLYHTWVRRCRTLLHNSHDGFKILGQLFAFQELAGRTTDGLFFKADPDRHGGYKIYNSFILSVKPKLNKDFMRI